MKEKKVSKLYIVRHGQTDWNAEGRIQGSTDRPLDETGRSQAHAVGKELSKLRPAAIYSSPLLRARQTAEAIAAFHGHEILLEKGLREASYGSVDGITVEEFRARFKGAIEEKLKLPIEQQWKYKLAHDAESCEEIIERALPALYQIAGRHENASVIIVSHGFVLRALVSYLAEVSDETVRIPNCSVVVLEGDGSSLELTDYPKIQPSGGKAFVSEKPQPSSSKAPLA